MRSRQNGNSGLHVLRVKPDRDGKNNRLAAVAWLLSTLALAAGSVSAQTSPGAACASVLQGQVYDKFYKMDSRYAVDQFFQWACQTDFKTARDMHDSAISLGIPIDSVPINFGLHSRDENFRETTTARLRSLAA